MERHRLMNVSGAVALVGLSYAAGFVTRPLVMMLTPATAVTRTERVERKDETAARAAIDSLKDFRSLLGGAGVLLAEYQHHLAETTIAVNRYTREAAPGSIRDAIDTALNAYSLAGTSWRVATVGGYIDHRTFHGNPALRCPALIQRSQERAASGASGPAADPAWTVAVGHGAQALWSCASDKIAEAETLIGATK